MVTVLAGGSEEPFIVHRDILCKKSEFFKSACSPEWLRGQERRIRVPLVEPTIFELYAHWLYSDKVEVELDMLETNAGAIEAGLCNSDECSLQLSDAPENEALEEHNKAETLQLTQLYVAADMLLDKELKLRVMDEMARRTGHHRLKLTSDTLLYVYANTTRGCGLRLFVFDRFLSSKSEKRERYLLESESELPKEYFVDLAVRQVQMVGKDCRKISPRFNRRCRYHDHQTEEERLTCEAYDALTSATA